LEEVRELAASSRFDYYCWDLYAQVTEWYEADKTRLKLRTATLHDIEHGGNENADIAAVIAEAIVRRHLQTMARLDVEYDLLTWEGDILRLQFWARAFEILKGAGAVYLQTSGKNAGCWVMEIEEETETETEADAAAAADEDAGPEDADAAAAASGDAAPRPDVREKVIVRSDGTVTYVGKDIAYQFWKFGLLGRDFHYRRFGTRADGRPLWATSSRSEDSPDGEKPPAFGRAAVTYNVIDVRQSYLQKLLKQALATMGYREQAERSVHFAYEMVALSHATARELGYDAEADAGKPFVEVSGRKGLGVKADDLLDRMVEKALLEVAKRNPDMTPEECDRTARAIGTAAVRYFMVKYSRGKVLAFDIDEALSFEGESGPYLQYAAVRARNIFSKLHEREGVTESDLIQSLASTSPDALQSGAEADDIWSLVLEGSRIDEVAEQATRTLELSVLAKYTFGLAQRFNAFYHRYPILNEERLDVRRWRAAVVSHFRQQLTTALDLMGCRAPSRM
jgi:arginyl-tRNA synthetase